MDNWTTLLVSALLLITAAGLMHWHVRSWRGMQSADMAENELDFYRRQFRRRIQTSAMLGILAVLICIGEFLPMWIDSRTFLIVYWAATLLLVVWVALLAVADFWATKYHFGQLRDKCLIEQAKLHAEIRRVRSVRGNGKPPSRTELGEG
jgi:hypothetical protein